MIEAIIIKNFQSHKNTTLKFHEGVNTVIGPSDSGKTAILRALRWAIWNRPLGDAFRSNWGGDTSVQIEFDDYIIERFKGKEDHYKLFLPEEEDLLFKAFGTEVPEEISRAMNLGEINVQNQMDSPFLISNNPGEVSRHFNKIARIDQIDSSLKNVNSWLLSINQDKKATEKEILRIQSDLTEFKYLDKMEAEVEILEQLESDKNSLENSQSRLSKLINDLTNVEEEIVSKSELLPLEKPVLQILRLYEEKADLAADRKRLKSLAKQVYQLGKDIQHNKEIIEDEETVNLVLDLYNSKDQLETEFNKLQKLITNIEDMKVDIQGVQNHLEELETKWHNEMPDVCPLCGQEVL